MASTNRPVADLPCAAVADGVLLTARVTPRSSRNGLAGCGVDGDGRPLLLVRLAAPPADGMANAALIALLAGLLDVRKSAVTIRSGGAARTKRVHVAGRPDRLLAAVARMLRDG